MKLLRRRINAAASALIISLIFLVLITVMVLATITLSEQDRSLSGSHLDKVRAEYMARMALDDAMSRLRSVTANTDIVWISQPGQLMASDPASSKPFELSRAIDLHSGESAEGSPNLNIPTLTDSARYLILDPQTPSGGSAAAPVPMRPAWIPVTDASGGTVGRYAFWVDDESCKINYNLAWKRNSANTNPLASPTQMNLLALEGFTEAAADTLHEAITNDGYQTAQFFNTPYDARRIQDADVPNLLQQHKFNLTHFSHSPDSTFFNEPRIVLTTQESRANGLPFLDILQTPNTDPGAITAAVGSTINSAKLNQTLTLLKSYLQRNDWPMTALPRSLQDKYYSGNSDRLTQLALNIIDYVRSKESASPYIFPLRGGYDASGQFVIAGGNVDEGFFGVARTPMITEIGAHMNAARTEVRLKVEIHLPARYGIASIPLTDNYFRLFSRLYAYPQATVVGSGHVSVKGGEWSKTELQAGEYAVITRTLTLTNPPASRPTELYVRVLFGNAIGDLDIAPYKDSQTLAVPIDNITVGEANIRSMEVDDPRVNKHGSDWKVSAKNTFGQQNSNYKKGYNASIIPEQDTDSSGSALSDASFYMPAPRGAATNPQGIVNSPGELGYIHTGVEGLTKAGIPWRTLRLQPNRATTTGDVPDWALMDIFAAPVEMPPAAARVFQPYVGAIGGRMNINTAVPPFSLERKEPLAALLLNAQKSVLSPNTVTASEARALAQNIHERTLATRGKTYGWADGYDSPGEIVEIAGIADQGEESEEMVRQVINLITTRSNVFTVYAIGQSLKGDSITGEHRTQWMIERIDDPAGVRFRTIYNRPLYP